MNKRTLLMILVWGVTIAFLAFLYKENPMFSAVAAGVVSLAYVIAFSRLYLRQKKEKKAQAEAFKQAKKERRKQKRR